MKNYKKKVLKSMVKLLYKHYIYHLTENKNEKLFGYL